LVIAPEKWWTAPFEKEERRVYTSKAVESGTEASSLTTRATDQPRSRSIKIQRANKKVKACARRREQSFKL
jgi:hypothetical protein